MRILTRSLPNPARALLILLWGSLCCLIFAAPLLVSHTKYPALAAVLYLFFAPVCHQNPERSFFIWGYALAVCQRCTGIYLGLFLSSILPFESRRLLASPLGRRTWVLGAMVPLLLDIALPYFGVWTNSSVSRFTTGLIFGAMLSSLLVPAVEELLGRALSRPPRLQASYIKGGTS
jgi:uncharacterized membrane protein